MYLYICSNYKSYRYFAFLLIDFYQGKYRPFQALPLAGTWGQGDFFPFLLLQVSGFLLACLFVCLLSLENCVLDAAKAPNFDWGVLVTLSELKPAGFWLDGLASLLEPE